jgi:hypothetical protein
VAGGAAGHGPLLLHGVVQHGRDQNGGIGDAVVAKDPQGDPERVVQVRLAAAALASVQLGGPVRGVAGNVPGVRG